MLFEKHVEKTTKLSTVIRLHKQVNQNSRTEIHWKLREELQFLWTVNGDDGRTMDAGPWHKLIVLIKPLELKTILQTRLSGRDFLELWTNDKARAYDLIDHNARWANL